MTLRSLLAVSLLPDLDAVRARFAWLPEIAITASASAGMNAIASAFDFSGRRADRAYR